MQREKIIFITGGARSGKSSFAEQLAQQMGKDVAYIATSIAARKGGLGSLFINHITTREAIIASGAAVLPAFYFFEWNSLGFVTLSFIVSLGLVKFFDGKIGGMTGDTLGALNEIGQILMLFGFLVYYNLI